MGKVRKQRPRRVRHEPLPPPLTHEETAQHSGLLLDLSSLSETKRENSLALIASITRFNPRLVTPELLAKLHLRLTDASLRVRVLAANALRNVAAEAALVSRLVQAGSAAAAVAVLASELRAEVSGEDPALPLFVHLVSALTSIQ